MSAPSATPTNTKDLIDVYVHGEHRFVWNADDVLRLRKEFRIVGSLVGSLPEVPNQLQIQSLPLLLSLPELCRLVNLGAVRLLDERTPYPKLTADDVQSWTEFRQSVAKYEAYIATLSRHINRTYFTSLPQSERSVSRSKKRKKARQGETKTADDNAGSAEEPAMKMRKLDASSAATTRSAPAPTNVDTAASTSTTPLDLHSISVRARDFDEPASSIGREYTLVPAAAADEWVRREARVIAPGAWLSNIASAQSGESGEQWSALARARCIVFAEAHRRGFYVTNASKFGGDFLLYEGDPLRYHAAYVVCVVDGWERLSPLQMVCFGRLGTSVKKTVVLASVDTSVNDSLHWWQDGADTRVRFIHISWRGDLPTRIL